jgi:hypothetical protein
MMYYHEANNTKEQNCTEESSFIGCTPKNITWEKKLVQGIDSKMQDTIGNTKGQTIKKWISKDVKP